LGRVIIWDDPLELMGFGGLLIGEMYVEELAAS
jgi:hypothetical protein